MGKNLKGKECGKGICQRKDGLYSARYVDELGKRHDKYFPTLVEARNWLKQAKEAKKCDPAKKQEKINAFAEELVSQGGPAVDQFKKLFGEETARRIVLKHMYGADL